MIGLLGLFLLYFIGKNFYDLAGKHNRSRWGYAILGVVSYYAGIFLCGILLAIIIEFGTSSGVEDFSDIVLGLMAIPAGLLCCWIVYRLLHKAWNKPAEPIESEVLDADLMEE